MKEELSPENEVICEKLLGWRKCSSFGAQCAGWTRPDSAAHSDNTPDFTTWAEAGLILDWLMSRLGPGLTRMRDGLALDLRGRTLTPAIVRAAALEYIRSQS